ncbi:MAG: FGGY-family carbohydrate kinase [Oscillospiraceae bacterium]|nr:FGGY-family carbohydrate kinase [Oscillospiraceae bacterium]
MYIIIYDFGTSSVKTCLFEIGSEIRLAASATAGYDLYISDNGGAEQDTEQWWAALCSTTRELFQKTSVRPSEIEGMAFCSQMQGTVFVDESGNALRRPMNYLDQKGVREYQQFMGSGLIKVSGCSLYKLLRNLLVNYAGSTSAKDPVWKYKWVENNEPDVFKKIYKWLDIGDYLVARCTGRIVRTADSAFATFLYDTRKGKEGWNKGLLKMYQVKPDHMPDIIDCTDLVGGLTAKAAEELGLAAGTPVFGGGGDTTFVNIGAGCTRPGDTHIYVGTSGWVSTFLDHQTVDIGAMITGVLSAKHGYFNYYAELETAGKCFEWVKDHLALDEVGVYLEHTKVTDLESNYTSVYEYLSEEVGKVPPGANGVIFTPWLHGNRCPFEDSNAGGMFFNIRIENGKRDMIRAVLEGICYHLRWLLESEMRKVKTSDVIRFVGGGALSPVTCQMLADVTGRTVETVNNTQEVGAIGTALVVAAGIQGADVLELARRLVKANHVYTPNPENKDVYERNYQVFKRLYRTNAGSFRELNGGKKGRGAPKAKGGERP